jgi:preprotein translocase subunit YajC
VDFLYAASQPGQGGGGLTAFLPFLLIIFIIYFLMIRPQTKRRKEKESMRESLKKGDKIITMGGIYGTVAGFKEKGRQAVIKVDNNTNITMNKTAIAGLAGKVKDSDLEQA